MFSFRFGGLLFALLLSLSASGFDVPPLEKPVTDLARLLPKETERVLDQGLSRLTREGGPQIAILTLPDLGGSTVEQVSIQVTDRWQLGDKKRDDGVLILVALAERRIRIEVGQGLEGLLTDAHSKRIIDQAMVPLFRAGDPGAAILVGVFEVLKKVAADRDPHDILGSSVDSTLHRPELPRGLGVPALVLVVCFVFIAMMAFMGGGHRFVGGRRPWGYGSDGGWPGSGGGFGGSGSGGFGGGGGGFSGGGASGGW